jgi:regulator of protease activity HflC (stomatin/prohibitin superfamily)
MQSLIDFLLNFVHRLIPFWPVLPWEGGVRTTGIPFGPMLYKEVKPGLRWKWPLIGMIHTVNTKRQTLKTPSQTVFTKDGEPISARLVITHAIRSPVRVFVHVHDYEGALQERTQVFLAEFIGSVPVAQVSVDSVNKAVQPRVKREAGRWGCEVESVGVVDLASPIVLQILGTGEQSPYLQETWNNV